MAFGFLGGLLTLRGLEIPYLAAGLAFVLLSAILLFYFPEDPGLKKGSASPRDWALGLRGHLSEAFRQGILRPELRPLFLANILIQFSIQPILHYWQPLFQSIDPAASGAVLGGVFSAYAATSAVLGLVYARYSGQPAFRKPHASVILFALFSCLYVCLPFCPDWPTALVVFCLLQGVLSVARSSISARMNEQVSNASRASVLSSLSLFSRVGSLAALSLVPWSTGPHAGGLESASALFKQFSWISFVICVPLVAGIFAHTRRFRRVAQA